VLAIGAALGLMGIGGLATFLVLYAVDIGFSAAAAGALLAVGSVLGISMRLVAGWNIDRREVGGFPTVAMFLILGAAGLALVASGVELLVVVGSLVAFTFGWGWSGLFTFSVVRANQAAPAASTAITQTGSFVGGAAGPALFGIIAEGVSFTAAWILMAIALLAAGVLVRFVSGRLPN
jgi:MFS family permease